MAIRVNPLLIDDLERYGAEDVQKCYHCGNCSAVCPHTDETFLFPRRSMRLLQMGLERRIEGSLEPWLCYYCGQCSDQCPRDAEPGETMMSLRRWLTSRYDFTGISRLFYRSPKAEVLAMAGLGLAVGIGLVAWGLGTGGDIRIYDGPGAFLRSEHVHRFDWGMAAVLVGLLGTNAVRMWWFTMYRDKESRVPLSLYIKHVLTLPYQFFTQKRYAECGERKPWLLHLGLMLSYLTMLVLIMFFLGTMQSDTWHWQAHAFGYLATVGLLGATAWMIRGRVRKQTPLHRHSHESDWVFLVQLFAVAFTGILQHVLHRAGQPLAGNVVYVIHMMVAVPMLVLEVPFSKWAHLVYRPLAMYFAAMRREVLRARAPAPLPAGARRVQAA